MHEIIADGEYYGMQTFDQSLAKLFEPGKVDMRARDDGRLATPTTSRSCSSSVASWPPPAASRRRPARPNPPLASRRDLHRHGANPDTTLSTGARGSTCGVGHTRSRSHVAWVTSTSTRGGA